VSAANPPCLRASAVPSKHERSEYTPCPSVFFSVQLRVITTPTPHTSPRAYQIVYLHKVNYRDFIEIRPDKRFGKPCLVYTRISVYDVLNWLANGMSRKDILEDFEELSEEMINACLAYAADKEHRVKIAS